MPEGFEDLWIDLARTQIVRMRRTNSEFSAAFTNRMDELLPFVQGTESYRQWIRETLISHFKTGVNKRSHYLPDYLFPETNDSGGIFDIVAVEGIERKAFRIFNGEVEYYKNSGGAVLPGMSLPVDQDYLNGLMEKRLIWQAEFMVRFGLEP